jgi:trimeric autotransporter adhesin
MQVGCAHCEGPSEADKRAGDTAALGLAQILGERINSTHRDVALLLLNDTASRSAQHLPGVAGASCVARAHAWAHVNAWLIRTGSAQQALDEAVQQLGQLDSSPVQLDAAGHRSTSTSSTAEPTAEQLALFKVVSACLQHMCSTGLEPTIATAADPSSDVSRDVATHASGLLPQLQPALLDAVRFAQWPASVQLQMLDSLARCRGSLSLQLALTAAHAFAAGEQANGNHDCLAVPSKLSSGLQSIDGLLGLDAPTCGSAVCSGDAGGTQPALHQHAQSVLAALRQRSAAPLMPLLSALVDAEEAPGRVHNAGDSGPDPAALLQQALPASAGTSSVQTALRMVPALEGLCAAESARQGEAVRQACHASASAIASVALLLLACAHASGSTRTSDLDRAHGSATGDQQAAGNANELVACTRELARLIHDAIAHMARLQGQVRVTMSRLGLAPFDGCGQDVPRDSSGALSGDPSFEFGQLGASDGPTCSTVTLQLPPEHADKARSSEASAALTCALTCGDAQGSAHACAHLGAAGASGRAQLQSLGHEAACKAFLGSAQLSSHLQECATSFLRQAQAAGCNSIANDLAWIEATQTLTAGGDDTRLPDSVPKSVLLHCIACHLLSTQPPQVLRGAAMHCLAKAETATHSATSAGDSRASHSSGSLADVHAAACAASLLTLAQVAAEQVANAGQAQAAASTVPGSKRPRPASGAALADQAGADAQGHRTRHALQQAAQQWLQAMQAGLAACADSAAAAQTLSGASPLQAADAPGQAAALGSALDDVRALSGRLPVVQRVSQLLAEATRLQWERSSVQSAAATAHAECVALTEDETWKGLLGCTSALAVAALQQGAQLSAHHSERLEATRSLCRHPSWQHSMAEALSAVSSQVRMTSRCTCHCNCSFKQLTECMPCDKAGCAHRFRSTCHRTCDSAGRWSGCLANTHTCRCPL